MAGTDDGLNESTGWKKAPKRVIIQGALPPALPTDGMLMPDNSLEEPKRSQERCN